MVLLMANVRSREKFATHVINKVDNVESAGKKSVVSSHAICEGLETLFKNPFASFLCILFLQISFKCFPQNKDKSFKTNRK